MCNILLPRLVASDWWGRTIRSINKCGFQPVYAHNISFAIAVKHKILWTMCHNRKWTLVRQFEWLADMVTSYKNMGMGRQLLFHKVCVRLQLRRLWRNQAHEMLQRSEVRRVGKECLD